MVTVTTFAGGAGVYKAAPKVLKLPEGKTTVTSNFGNTYDYTPSMFHRITSESSLTGPPNSSADILNKQGKITKRSWFGKDGGQKRDVDLTNHGNAARHPETPHEHGSRKEEMLLKELQRPKNKK